MEQVFYGWRYDVWLAGFDAGVDGESVSDAPSSGARPLRTEETVHLLERSLPEMDVAPYREALGLQEL